jgi:hypothetical protein
MDISGQQFTSDIVSAVGQPQKLAASTSSPNENGFGEIKAEIFGSMKVFETMSSSSVNSLKLGGNSGDFRTTSLELARFRADMYKIETVATAAQNVIGTFKNFVSTFTK